MVSSEPGLPIRTDPSSNQLVSFHCDLFFFASLFIIFNVFCCITVTFSGTLVSGTRAVATSYPASSVTSEAHSFAGTFAAATCCIGVFGHTEHHLVRLASALSRSAPPYVRSISCRDALFVVASWNENKTKLHEQMIELECCGALFFRDTREKEKVPAT